MIKTLRIGGFVFAVKQEKNLTADFGGQTTRYNGIIRYEDCEIEIAADRPEPVKAATLWHEALHGILEQAGIVDQPENIITALGYGVVALFRDNPAFVRWTAKVMRNGG